MGSSSILITDNERKLVASISSNGKSIVETGYKIFEVDDSEAIYVKKNDSIYISEHIEELMADEEE